MNTYRSAWLGTSLAVLLALGCGRTEDSSAAVGSAKSPTSHVASLEVRAAASAPDRTVTLIVAGQGTATFLIDAPLEQIRGKAHGFRGTLTFDPQRLGETRGQVEVDLTTLETHTFEDAAKNAKQTEHMRNWLELGDEVTPKQRLENQWARFTLRSVQISPDALDRVPEVDGRRRLEATAVGDLWLHGVTSPQSIRVALTFVGPPDAPREVRLATVSPVRVSLRKHDIKPRDLAGRFLQGALEQVGDKIVDEVAISLTLSASLKPGEKPVR